MGPASQPKKAFSDMFELEEWKKIHLAFPRILFHSGDQ